MSSTADADQMEVLHGDYTYEETDATGRTESTVSDGTVNNGRVEVDHRRGRVRGYAADGSVAFTFEAGRITAANSWNIRVTGGETVTAADGSVALSVEFD